jgi:hypothetical protein
MTLENPVPQLGVRDAGLARSAIRCLVSCDLRPAALTKKVIDSLDTVAFAYRCFEPPT